MKLRALVFAGLLLLLSFSGQAASAQEPALEIPRGSLTRPVPQAADPNQPISNATASRMFTQCRSFYPRRFTPGALDYYCTCAATATQAEMTAAEYQHLEDAKNRNVKDPAFQKYVSKVITPCMGPPTSEIEYFSCVVNKTNDPRISDIPKYCQCVSRKMQSHVETYGDVEILISLGSRPGMNDPVEALWMNRRYLQTLKDEQDNCQMNYLKPPQRYN